MLHWRTTQESVDAEFDAKLEKLWKKPQMVWLKQKIDPHFKEKTNVFNFSNAFLKNTHCGASAMMQGAKISENKERICDFYANFNALTNWLADYFSEGDLAGRQESLAQDLIQAKAKGCIEVLDR